MHAVQRLYQYRKSLSTKPFKSRGKQISRCDNCQLALEHCMCCYRSGLDLAPSDTAFVLLMYDAEVLKPSNTARLIADIIKDTHAFLWSRTSVNQALLAILNQPQFQPIIIFPREYANENQRIFSRSITTRRQLGNSSLNETTKNKLTPDNRRPLFILLDGTWKEAKKMFRKSPYLHTFPILSLEPEKPDHDILDATSQYYLRQSSHSHHLATAEVAAQALHCIGDMHHAKRLQSWFDLFSFQYQKSVSQKNQGRSDALQQWLALTDRQAPSSTP